MDSLTLNDAAVHLNEAETDDDDVNDDNVDEIVLYMY